MHNSRHIHGQPETSPILGPNDLKLSQPRFIYCGRRWAIGPAQTELVRADGAYAEHVALRADGPDKTMLVNEGLFQFSRFAKDAVVFRMPAPS